ncbi:MAG: tetratricopeptide repeat protein [Deltaproteobacteria bacterium]|nr:tetratricopeptide repeat protein [Deltaproteobacteria bacterium]
MNRWRTPSFLPLSAAVAALVFAAPGCLKTRTQVRPDSGAQEESYDGTRGAPAPKQSRVEIEEMKTEITRISGKLDEIDHVQRTRNSADVSESLARLDTRVAELEKNQILVMSELKELKDHGVAAPSGKAGAAAGASKPGKREAAEAHFAAGETEYGAKNYKKAIVEYSKVQEVFPKSPRMPASLFKIGLCFEKLGRTKEAQGFFSELTEKYPNSAEAKKARGRLKDQM